MTITIFMLVLETIIYYVIWSWVKIVVKPTVTDVYFHPHHNDKLEINVSTHNSATSFMKASLPSAA